MQDWTHTRAERPCHTITHRHGLHDMTLTPKAVRALGKDNDLLRRRNLNLFAHGCHGRAEMGGVKSVHA
jgi:hypothetical protein